MYNYHTSAIIFHLPAQTLSPKRVVVYTCHARRSLLCVADGLCAALIDSNEHLWLQESTNGVHSW